jgi:hypothetical protein
VLICASSAASVGVSRETDSLLIEGGEPGGVVNVWSGPATTGDSHAIVSSVRIDRAAITR